MGIKKEVSVGQVFGKLTIVSESNPIVRKDGRLRRKFICNCSCGNTINVQLDKLSSSKTVSCGCVRKKEILIGSKFNNLTVLREVEESIEPSGDKHRVFLCLCDCGKTTNVRLRRLTSLKSKSCGCHVNTANGDSSTKLYGVWKSMVIRCEKRARYRDRGIKVCKEWLDWMTFKDWAISSGYEVGLQIDRKNNDSIYAPLNCRWVTPVVNSNNRGNNIIVKYNGEQIPLSILLRSKGKLNKYDTIKYRIKKGWRIEDAVDVPIGERPKKQNNQ